MPNIQQYNLQRYLIGILILVNMLGLFNPLFLGDSALYACVAKEMVQSGNWWELSVKGLDWLDKPHFPFWVQALFFKAFGFSTFVYKLPAFLFFGLSVLYTWKLSRRLYNQEVAELSVLILLSALHIIISNNDVRAEPYLMGTLIPATYFFIMLYRRYTLHDLFLGALFAALAVMTKGYFVLIPIVSAIGLHAIAKKKWRKLLHWKWLAASILILIFILPELYALYIQFDLHPEKVVFDQTHVSGIKFFLWDSQFGRFFNNGPIRGNGEPSFFIHTTLWAFAPWGIIAFLALFVFGKNWLKKCGNSEFFTFGAFFSMFIIFSLSKFQLPHYTNIIFPFLSILVAQYLHSLFAAKTINALRWIQYFHIFVFTIGLVAIYFIFQPAKPYFLGGILAFSGILSQWIYKNTKSVLKQVIQLSALLAIFIGLYMNVLFYPKLLTYQAGVNAAVYTNKQFPNETIYLPRETNSYTFEFLLDKPILRFNVQDIDSYPPDNSLVYTFKKHLDSLLMQGYNFEVLDQFEGYHITKLTPKFLNAKTRQEVMGSMYLIRLRSKDGN